jgi:hypothetical protein
VQPNDFRRPNRFRNDGQDAVLAVVFFVTIALAVGIAALFVGSGWTPPDASGLAPPVETRSSALFGTSRPEALTGPPTPTATPTATATAIPVPPTPTPGQYWMVGNTGEDGGTWLRGAPQIDDQLLFWPDGTQMIPVGPDVQEGDRIWRQVQDPRGNRGYVQAEHVSATGAPPPNATPLPGLSEPSPTPTPTITPTATPGPRAYVVGNTGGSGGVWLRNSPTLGDRSLILVDGTRVVTIGPDVQSEGRLWRHVRDLRGNEGYIPEEWLVPAP